MRKRVIWPSDRLQSGEHMGRTQPYFVFMCPRCRHFTLAPAGQKRRRCSYCGKIIDIRRAAKAVFDDASSASAAVREYNARGSDEFYRAVERSRERVLALLPDERVDIEEMTQDAPVTTGKRRRLMQLLEREACDTACPLDRIAELCPEYQLDWEWVEQLLNRLANDGIVFFPHPWSVKLTAPPGADSKPQRTVDVKDEIVGLLRQHGPVMLLEDVVAHFAERGVSRESVEESLKQLLWDGVVYQPLTDRLALVE